MMSGSPNASAPACQGRGLARHRRADQHVLLFAPTERGKTLAAVLWALDNRLTADNAFPVETRALALGRDLPAHQHPR